MRPVILPLLVLLACVPENQIIGSQENAGVFNPRVPDPVSRTDRLVQTPNPEVDVLFVVDNSCSMQTSQDELAANFPVFFSYFEGSGIDYHIGVVSTDMVAGDQAGRLQVVAGRRWVDDETDNAQGVFSAMVGLGVSGSATEQGIAAAYAALEVHRDDHNADFRRDDAGLVIVTISDEEDQSNAPTPDEFASYLNTLPVDPEDVTFSSIVTMNGFDRGDRYMYVTQQVGGEIWDITEPDWAPVLDAIGLSAAGLSRRFYLSRIPVPGTIEVRIETDGVVRVMEQDVDWTYDSLQNSVVFTEYLPEPLSTVEITYDVLAASVGQLDDPAVDD